MAGTTTTARTKQMYEAKGWVIDHAEHFNWHTQRKKDLFGFIDQVASNGEEIHFIQATSTGNMSARRKKILGNECAKVLSQLPCGKIILIGWKKYDKAVDRKKWRPTIEEITPDMF